MSVLENLIAPVAGLAAHLGRGVGRIATDAAIGRLRSMPRTVGDLDALTMSQLTGRVVTSVTVLGGDAGTSSRTRDSRSPVKASPPPSSSRWPPRPSPPD